MLRYLLSKIVHRPDTVERIDILLMYEQILKCQDIAVANDSFQTKFGLTLEVVSRILKGFRLKPKTTNLDIRKLAAQIKQEVPNFIYPERNLQSVGTHVIKMFYVSKVQPLGKEVKLLPPKAYIGKGYTDKGTASDPAFDGSPSWQEVATFNSREEEDET
jgi:putative transposon-encoded protein